MPPLWQVMQVPGVTPAWVNLAGVHAVVRWHESHDAVVRIWLAGLPELVIPLWQLMQAPGATPIWLNRAPTKVVVLWQVSQVWTVWMCVRGITTDDILPPAAWQAAHCLGVPLKSADT